MPVSVVRRVGVEPDGGNPGVITAYGSYEISSDPYFSVARLSLLDRGVVYAVAHVRGGGEMGRRWYDDGKLFAKTNLADILRDEQADVLVAADALDQAGDDQRLRHRITAPCRHHAEDQEDAAAQQVEGNERTRKTELAGMKHAVDASGRSAQRFELVLRLRMTDGSIRDILEKWLKTS